MRKQADAPLEPWFIEMIRRTPSIDGPEDSLQTPCNGIAQPKSSVQPVRRYPRTILSVPIDISMLTPGAARTHGVSLDISEGGLGAIVQSPPKPGDVIEIDLQLPAQGVTTVAIVRYASSARCGFEFMGLSTEKRARLAGIVATVDLPAERRQLDIQPLPFLNQFHCGKPLAFCAEGCEHRHNVINRLGRILPLLSS